MLNPLHTPPKFTSYGEESILVPGNRVRINVVSLFVNLLAPWLLFCSVFAAMSFTIHYYSNGAAYGVVFFGYCLSLCASALAFRAKRRQADPMWYHFASISFFIAVTAGAILGDAIYHYYMHTFYDIENSNTYPAVNPTENQGQQLMDSGRVYFTYGTKLDEKRSTAFKNNDIYCVAPITLGDDKLPSYDFWAVGVNCCSNDASDFHCGEYKNPNARAGLRQMRDDRRPFFRLAVQQAEAKFNVKASHPLFFYWLQDPIAEMNSYQEEGFKYYLLGILLHFGFNCACVGFAVIGFGKLGHKELRGL